MRLFIAVCFSDDVLDRILKETSFLEDELSVASFSGRQNIHLTLNFLGECEKKDVDRISGAMERISFEPFVMTMDRIGAFSRPDGDIVWLGVDGSDALRKLHDNLCRSLFESGISFDRNRFKPHITLARRARGHIGTRTISPIDAEVISIHLMLSQRVDGRMVYTPLYTKRADAVSSFGV